MSPPARGVRAQREREAKEERGKGPSGDPSPPAATAAGQAPGPAEAHLAAESVILITTDGELPLPLLHAGRRLLQGCGQPGVALPQGLQLNLPLLYIGSTVGVTGDGRD